VSFDPGTESPPPRRRAREVFIATKNPGKQRELQALLEESGLRVIGPELVTEMRAPVEDGATFRANARKKAIHYSRGVDKVVLADDSGLEIDALEGEPGVRSARFGGASATDDDRVRMVLRRMEGVPWEERTARFRCVVAIARRGEVLVDFDGVVEGLITFEPQGGEGFGYDPIFYFGPMDRTFSEMTREEKDRVSHRGQALEGAVTWLKENAESLWKGQQ
jgi:XTP/dITP diphosphohydrolase